MKTALTPDATDNLTTSTQHSLKLLRIQRLQFRHDEPSVLADQPVVEPYFAAAGFRGLHHHHVPVDLALLPLSASS